MSVSPAKAKMSAGNLSLEEIFGLPTSTSTKESFKVDEEPPKPLKEKTPAVVEEDPQLTELRAKRKSNVTYSKAGSARKTDIASRIAIASAKLSATGSFESSPVSSKPQSTNSSFAVDLPELEEAKFDGEYEDIDSQETSKAPRAVLPVWSETKAKPVDASSLFNALQKESQTPQVASKAKQINAETQTPTKKEATTKEKSSKKQGDLRSFFSTSVGKSNSSADMEEDSDGNETPRKRQKTRE